MKGISIRWRLTVWCGVVFGAVLAAFAVVVYVTMLRYVTKQIDYVVREELVEMEQQVEASRDRADLHLELTQWFAHHEACEFEVSDLQGESFFRGGRLGTDRLLQFDPADVPDEGRWDDQLIPGLGHYRVGSQRVSGPTGAFIVQVASPWKSHDSQLSALLHILLLAGPAVLGLTTWGGYVLVGRALAPVDRMAAAADKITFRALDRRLIVPKSNDELSRLARTLNGMLDRLHNAFREIQRFTADAAHELRTPLAVLRSTAEVGLRTARSRKDLWRALENMLDVTIGMSRLSDQLLFLCHEEAGVGAKNREAAPISKSLESVAAEMDLVAGEKGVKLEVRPLGSWVVDSDELQMRRVWYNLLDNAIKYTPAGGTVIVSGCVSQHYARIEVEDSGCGIPADHLPHIFDRFYRVDKARSRSAGGTGLGLAICKAIVESHHGTIKASSASGCGTRFSVELPLTSMGESKGPVVDQASASRSPLRSSSLVSALSEGGVNGRQEKQVQQC